MKEPPKYGVPPADKIIGSMRVVELPKPKRKGALTRTKTDAVLGTTYEEIMWIVEGYLPEGFSVLAGRQKLGKTWLAIDWAAAVAEGGHAMGSIKVEPGYVLYLDFENGPRRIQRRLKQIFPDWQCRDLSRLEWATEAPPLDDGLIDALDDWRTSVALPRLVIIDVLQRIKPAGLATRNAYENDYTTWAPLQHWALKHGVGVMGLHHTRKGGADDPLEALSGSNGLSAVADTTLVLDRDGNGTTLYVRGRDVDEKETAMKFDAGLWSIMGEARKVRTTSERQAILAVLMEATEPMKPAEIADATEMTNQSVRQTLSRMSRAGEVVKAGYGRYVHPDHAPPVTVVTPSQSTEKP